ncbi:MAG: hypothetical protein COA78_20150 [Blastopirellula sp.]|nr:MAG: hypothetical protein COA78_20150 [Blastopirellula sp.]
MVFLTTSQKSIWLRGLTFAVLALMSSPVIAVVREDFEAAESSWRFLYTDARAKVPLHQRTNQEAHFGQGSEQISFFNERGSQVLFGHSLEPSSVISELKPSLWLKSDRAGMQLLVRVIFPRSINQQTGTSNSTLLVGDIYQSPGAWQKLGFTDLTIQLEQQVPVLRTRFGKEFDPREAYIDLMVLNLYSGVGTSSVWIDDLEITGHLSVPETRQTRPQRVTIHQASNKTDVVMNPKHPMDNQAKPLVVRNGETIELEGQPIVPRIIQYQGESLAELKQLGFNTIALDQAPTPELVAELAKQKMMMIAVGPERGLPSDPQYNQVLAWKPSQQYKASQLAEFAMWANDLRRADGTVARPIMATAEEGLYGFSRHADVLLHKKSLLGWSDSLKNLSPWLQYRKLSSSSGTMHWFTVPTQRDPQVVKQIQQLANSSEVTHGIDPVQLEQAAFTALSSGMQGLYFSSHSSLSADHPVDAIRRASVELINRRVMLIEPWIAAGRYVSEVDCKDPNVRVSLFSTQTALLLIAVRTQTNDQYVPAPLPEHNVVIQVPGVPAASEAYLIDNASLRPLSHKRSAGMRIVLDDHQQVSFIVLTQDPRVLRDLRRRIEENRGPIAQLKYDLASQSMQLVQAIDRSLGTSRSNAGLARMINQAWANLREAGRSLESSNLALAEKLTQESANLLQQAKRIQWEQLSLQYESPVTNPLMISYDLLPLATQLQSRLASMSPAPNKLAGGDMEDLSYLLTTGWRQIQQTPMPRGYKGNVELSNTQAHQGHYDLHLQIQADRRGNIAQLESPPIKVISAPIDVSPGQLILVRGWFRIDQPLASKSDGLIIYDSIGGKELALHVHEAPQWKEFSLIRAVGQQKEMRLHFELESVGDVYLDDITMEPYQAGTPRPRFAPDLPAVRQADSRFQFAP